MIRFDDPMESAEDPMGLERPADHDDATKASDLADALSELPEARIMRTPGAPREVLLSDGAPVAHGGHLERALVHLGHHVSGVGPSACRLPFPGARS